MRFIPLFLLFLLFCILSCSNNNTGTDNKTYKDYLDYYYKQPMDSTYTNFMLIITDTIPKGYDVYPRITTAADLSGDTVLHIVIHNNDTIVHAIFFGFNDRHTFDATKFHPADTGLYHGTTFYIKNGQYQQITDKYIFIK